MTFGQKIKDVLCILSGEDYTIINKISDRRTKNRFSFIGFVVLILFALCLNSGFVISQYLFPRNTLIDSCIGIFWALFIFLIYLFLLYTSTPNLLPSKYKKGKKIIIIDAFSSAELRKKFFNGNFGSVFFKIIFLLIISISVSVPIHYQTTYIGKKISFIEHTLHIIRDKPNSYYFLLFGIYFLLFSPIFFKYIIRKEQSFYKRKRKYENDYVKLYYKKFKIEYLKLLENNDKFWNERIRQNIEPYLQKIELFDKNKADAFRIKINRELQNKKFEFYEAWRNPPFNTIKKAALNNYKSEFELISEIYNDK